MANSYIAGADLSAKEGYAVKLSASSTVSLATTATIGTEDLVGIVAIRGGNTSGYPVTVLDQPGDRGRAKCGGALTRGTHRFLTTDANGKLVAAAAGDSVIAEWIGQGPASAADGDFIEVVINKFPYVEDTDT